MPCCSEKVFLDKLSAVYLKIRLGEGKKHPFNSTGCMKHLYARRHQSDGWISGERRVFIYCIFKGIICARQCTRGETTDLKNATQLPPPSDQVKNPGDFISIREERGHSMGGSEPWRKTVTQVLLLLAVRAISQDVPASVRLKNKEIKFHHWHSTLILLSWVAQFKNSKCLDSYILKLKLHQFNFEDSELSQPKKRKEPPGGLPMVTCSFQMRMLNHIDLLITTNYW